MKDRIAFKAIENLEKLLGIKGKCLLKPLNFKGGVYDCNLKLTINNHKKEFLCLVRKEIRETQIHAFLELVKENKRTLLIAESINPINKETLRKYNINYIDGEGNVYIDDNDVFVFVDRAARKKHEPLPNRAFTNAGLKVVFCVLVDPDLINMPYREIAKKANVALDTVNKVIVALVDMNFIIQLNNKERKLHNKKELFDMWITNYNTKLRNNILLGKYRFANKNTNWKDCKLKQHKTLWGGEAAANILTGYLQPEKFILYTQEQVNDLLKTLRIIPDEYGDITIYKKFWNLDNNENAAPAILVYADLLNTGDPRNIETAKIIYNERIKNKIE